MPRKTTTILTQFSKAKQIIVSKLERLEIRRHPNLKSNLIY